MKYLFILLLLLPVRAFGASYYFYESTSDCGSGDYFNEDMKLSQPASLDTILVVVPDGVSSSLSIFRTIADSPNNDDWETGAFTVLLKVVAYGQTPDVNLRISRDNSSCVNQEYSSWATQASIDSTGVYTFTVESKDWTSGDAGDRMSVVFNFTNGIGQDPDSVWIEVGSIHSTVGSEVTDNSEPEAAGEMIMIQQ